MIPDTEADMAIKYCNTAYIMLKISVPCCRISWSHSSLPRIKYTDSNKNKSNHTSTMNDSVEDLIGNIFIEIFVS